MSTALLIALMLTPAQTPAPAMKLRSIKEERIRKIDKDEFVGWEGLQIRTAVTGLDVKTVSRWGNLAISEAKDDTGADLIRKDESGVSFQATNKPDYQTVSDFDRRDGNLPFEIRLKLPARAATKCSLKGSLDLLVGGTKANLDFPKVRDQGGMELKHADLEALGAKLKVSKPNKNETGISYTLEGNSRLIEAIQLLDATGKKLETTSSSYQFGSAPRVYQLHPSGKIDGEPTLRIIIVKGARLQTVPFEFKDLQLP